MKKLGVLLATAFLGVSAYATDIQYKAECSSNYPGINFFHIDKPNIYKLGVNFHGEDTLPYLYYGLDSKIVELGLGAILNNTFENNLYSGAFFNSGLYVKSTLEPVALKYFLLPYNQYASLTLYDNFGVSLLSETFDPSSVKAPVDRRTISLFGSKKILGVSTHGAAYIDNAAGNGLDNSGNGYQVGVDTHINTGSLEHTFALDKIYWNHDSATNYNYKYPETYLTGFFSSLSHLRDQQKADTFYGHYGISIPIQNLVLKIDYHQIFDPGTSLFSFSTEYTFDNNIGLKTMILKSSNESDISFAINLIIISSLKL